MKNIHFQIRAALFFSMTYFYVWLWLDPALCYQWQDPVFLIDLTFFKESLSSPGGFIEYVSAFLSQYFYYPWLGAVIITLILWLIALTSRTIIESISGVRTVQIIHFFPPIFLLILHNQYLHPLSNDIALLISLVFTMLFIRINPRQRVPRLLFFFLLAIILYCAAAGPFLLFGLMCGLYELLKKQGPLYGRILHGLACILTAAVLPYLAVEYLFLVSFRNAYFNLLPFEHIYKAPITPYLLYLCFPLAIITISIVRHFTSEQTADEPNKVILFLNKIRASMKSRIGFILQTLIFFTITASAVLWSVDSKNQTIIRVGYYARHGMWQQILALEECRTASVIPLAYQTNRALFHTGRLLYDMFSFPQKWGTKGLILKKEFSFSAPLQSSDIYLELGHVNEAQHWAHEALTLKGETPWILRRLALVNILKNETHAANKFLRRLNKTLFFHEWVEYYRRCLNDSSLLKADPQIRHIRSLMPVADFIVNHDYPKLDLLALLKANINNKMAFEYLTAFNLLSGQLGGLVNNIQRLNDFDYTAIPRHYEEGLLIYMAKTGKKNLNLQGRGISSDTIERFVDFYQIIDRHNGNVMAAQSELRKTHKDTYWYYILFDKPGD